MNQLVNSTLRKLQWLVDTSYASAAVKAFSSRRKHPRVIKIHQHFYFDHMHIQTLTPRHTHPTIIQLPVSTLIVASYSPETKVPTATTNITASLELAVSVRQWVFQNVSVFCYTVPAYPSATGGGCILPCCIQFWIAKSAKWFKFGTHIFEPPMEREKQT